MALKDLAKKAKAVHAAKKELPFAEAFLRDLDSSIAEGEARGAFERVSLSPSSLGACVRKLWFEFMGTEPEQESVNVDSVTISNMGTATHDYIQRVWLRRMEEAGRLRLVDPVEWIDGLIRNGHPIEAVKRSGNEVKWEFRRWPLPVRGMCDGLIEYQGRLVILEIKTVDTNIFRSMVKPLQKHILQATVYGVALKLRYVLFLYVDRNGGKRRAFLLEITDDMVRELEERIDFLHSQLIRPAEGAADVAEGWQVADMPAVEPDRCKPLYCPFVKACKATGDFPK